VSNLKVDDRVRIVASEEAVGYLPGDKGTVVRVIGSSSVIDEDFFYDVAMDKDGPNFMMTFTPDKIELDL
jgi:hypothetical protein